MFTIFDNLFFKGTFYTAKGTKTFEKEYQRAVKHIKNKKFHGFFSENTPV